MYVGRINTHYVGDDMNLNRNDGNAEYFKATTILIKILALFLGAIILFFSQYGFIFYSAAMLPTVIVIFVDRKNVKCASATICTFNLIGTLPYLTQIWLSVSMNETAKILISDVKTWGVIYGSAVIGQFVYWIIPLVFSKLYMIKTKVEVAILNAHRDRLCTDWSIKLENLYLKNKREK